MLRGKIVSIMLSVAIFPWGHVVSMAQAPQRVSLGEELYRATEAADIAKVKDLIARGADVNWRDKNGGTALIVAAVGYENRHDKAEIAKLLVEAHADINAQETWGATALSYACGDKDVEIGVVKLLLDAGAEATGDDQKTKGGFALWEGVTHGNSPCVQLLLDHGANPNFGARRKSPILIQAVESGDAAMVKAFLAKGANPNFEDMKGNTALSAAQQARDVAVAKSRINGGREVFPNGLVIDWKEEAKDKEAMIDLLQGSRAAMPKPEIKTLADAAGAGDVAKVNAFLADGADLQAKDEQGMTPLHLAALRGHTDVVRALLAARAGLNARGQNGATPLILASEGGHADVVNLLLEARADVNAFDDAHQTALMLAIEWKHLDVARLLLSHRANPNAHEGDGYTAMYFAVMTGQKDAQQLLREAGAK